MSEEIEEIKKELQQLRTWLSQVDSRITQMESQRQQQSSQPLLSEVRVPEREKGILGGRTVTSQGSGLQREIRTPVCDICGKALTEDFSVCAKCGRKLDQACVKIFKGQKICFECLRRDVPIQPRDYLVLACVANRVSDVATISKLTKVPEENVRTSIDDLLSAGLIEKKGMLLFSELQITDEGMNAFSAYRSVFGSDYESLVLDKELRKYLRGRSRASRIAR
jgi:predicted transcriptional regulator